MKVDRIAQEISAEVQDLLPRSMAQIAGRIGLKAVVELVRHHGGGAPLYIPETASPDHPLWEQIGGEAMQALVLAYRGDRIEIPKCERAARELVYREIRHKHFVEGQSQGELALQYGYTARHIRSIVYQKPAAAVDERQTELF